MKPKFLAFPRHFALTSATLVATLAPLSTFAADFTWGGATDSTWTTPANWTTGTAPVYGTTYTADTLRVSNGAGAVAVYDPGSALTTTFGAGRAFILGSTTAGSLTVTSGTIAAVRAVASGNEPLMANGANASLLINGGAVDFTGHLNTFLFMNSGAAANTTNLTISSGSFSSNGFNFITSGTGAGTVNLDGGSMAVTAFTRTATGGSTVLNLNGGTLRIRSASSTSFLPALTGLQTIVKAGGAVIDSNSLNLTIAEVLEHDTTLGLIADGGLTKNGFGNLTLSGTSTFTGPVTINAGTAIAQGSRIILGSDSGAGTGSITLADSYAELQLALSRNIANPLVVSNTGDEKTVYFVNAGGAQLSGPITINETNIDHFRLRSDVSCNLTLSGKISGAGGIYKYQVGNSTLTNSANDFTGGVKINQGTISFASGALGTTGSILMDGGSLSWSTGNSQDVSNRLAMVDGKAATLVISEPTTFASAIGNNSTASLVKTGTNLLTLTQPSTYSGGTTVTNGTLEFATGGLGTTGSVTMNAGILRWTTGNTQDISSRIVMVNAKSAAFSTNGNDVTFATAIGNSSTGSFSKTSTAGILTLTGTNTYTGTTTVGGGTLRVNGSLDAASAVTVTGGDLGGTGTIGGTVTVAAAGNIAPGASAGTLTISGGLDIAAMAGGAGKLKFELDTLAGTNDKIVVGGTLTLGVGALGFGNFDFTNLGGLQAGTYTLITSTGITGGDSLDGADLSGVIGSFNGTLAISGNNIVLNVTAGGNTTPTISDIANQSVPSGGTTGPLAVTVGDAETAVGSLIVTGSSSNTTLVPNGNIVIGGSGASRTVTVTPVSGLSGTATITVTVNDGSLTANDTFTLTVTDNYLSWASSQVPPVTGGPGGDSDNDGVKNLIEYALVNGGERGVYSGNTITFTKRGAPYGGDVTYDIESSTLLTAGSWSTLAKPPVIESAGSISYTFTPGSPVKNFTRLKVRQVP